MEFIKVAADSPTVESKLKKCKETWDLCGKMKKFAIAGGDLPRFHLPKLFQK